MCLANSFKKTLSVLIVTEPTVPARADETHDRRVVERGGLPSANATGGAWALAANFCRRFGGAAAAEDGQWDCERRGGATTVNVLAAIFGHGGKHRLPPWPKTA